MNREEQLKMYNDFKDCVYGRDYRDIKLQSNFRKLRHHLDQIIMQLESLEGQKDPDFK